MKAYTKVDVSVILELSQEDAEWVKALVQNPTHDDESLEDSKRREALFNYLKDALNLPAETFQRF